MRLASAFDGFVNKIGEVFAPFIIGVFDSIGCTDSRCSVYDCTER